MIVRRRYLVCLAVILTAAIFRLAGSGHLTGTLRPPGKPVASVSEKPAIVAAMPGATPSVPAERTRWSRAEVTTYLRQSFSKELLQMEIDLEQARYRGQYWEAEPGLMELRRIETRRGEAVRQLTLEMNQLLAEMCPDEAGETPALSAFFSLDRPAPNLAFLGAASREKIEEAILAQEGTFEADRLAAVADAILSGQELTDYQRWNAPASAALRNRLVGFGADEQEFTAILQWQAAAGSDREPAARAELAQRLGPERLARLERQTGPEMSTALQDLHRLDRPLDQAGWLADFRRNATAQLQRLWDNPRLTPVQKQAQVALLENGFRAEIIIQLNLPDEATDLLP